MKSILNKQNDLSSTSEDAPRIAILVFPFAAPNIFSYAQKFVTTFALSAQDTIFISGGIPEGIQLPDQVQVRDLGIRLHYVNSIKPRWLSLLLWVVKVILLEIKQAWQVLVNHRGIDVFICTLGSYYLLSTITARLLGKKVITAHYGDNVQRVELSYNNKILTAIMNFLVKTTSSLSDHIIIESECIGRNVDALIPYRSKLVNGALYIDAENNFSITTPLSEREMVVGFIGRLAPEKGISEFLQAIPLVLEKIPDLKIFIIGAGSMDAQLEEALRDSSWSGQVSWLRWVEHFQIPEYLNMMKLLVMPSHIEGLPNLLLETMKCGTPVLASKAGGIPDLVVNHETGFLLEEVSPKSISSGILTALESDRLEDIVRQAADFVEQEFSLVASKNRFQAILKKIKN
jgi:glycosyltransferase involved in cell wall biosynthesis